MVEVNELKSEISRLEGQLKEILRKNETIKGEIEFVYAEKNAYPLAYVRSADSEKILVIINPADRAVSFESSLSLGECIYSFGGKSSPESGRINVPARSIATVGM